MDRYVKPLSVDSSKKIPYYTTELTKAIPLEDIPFYYIVQEGDRLDAIAGRFYGDGRLWWIVAASSGIGWWLQVPPGTRLLIPTDLNQIESVI